METYFFLIFRDYNSAEEHWLKGEAGVWEAAPLENSHVVFGSLEIFTASGIGPLNCSISWDPGYWIRVAHSSSHSISIWQSFNSWSTLCTPIPLSFLYPQLLPPQKVVGAPEFWILHACTVYVLFDHHLNFSRKDVVGLAWVSISARMLQALCGCSSLQGCPVFTVTHLHMDSHLHIDAHTISYLLRHKLHHST